MGVFREDEKIVVSKLINLFVAEGFLKPKEGQTLEEVAEDYLNDLVDRNLILVERWKRNGRIKYCKMHDLVREVCLKIGEREKIFHWMCSLEIPPDINRVRHIVFDGVIHKKVKLPEAFYPLPSASLVRTFLCNKYVYLLPFKSRLLRVLARITFDLWKNIPQLVNLRYLHCNLDHVARSKISSSVSLLWNVHTLIFEEAETIEAPLEIWYMRQLRHFHSYRINLPDPPRSEKLEHQDDAFLPNLQSLSRIENFSFTEEVCKSIPNIKKLRILYNTDLPVGECPKMCQYYLKNLYKLQSLFCAFGYRERGETLQRLVLPSSLRKLSLYNCGLHWEDINTFGLLLPHLQVLKLYVDAVVGPEWDCVEEAFPHLKVLNMGGLDMIKWTAESSDCFPVLEKLHLHNLVDLERIPPGIGETLGSLLVSGCSESAAVSSIEILEEQLSFGNEDFQLQLWLGYERKDHESFMEKVDVKSFTSKNLKLIRGDLMFNHQPSNLL